ncbi:Pept_C1 domain-containing protein, partial [Meloidogyne graminicola]
TNKTEIINKEIKEENKTEKGVIEDKENKKEKNLLNKTDEVFKNISLPNEENKNSKKDKKIEDEKLKENSKIEKKEENKKLKNEEKIKENENNNKIIKGSNNLRKSEKETRMGRRNKFLLNLRKEKQKEKGLKGKWKSGINERISLLSDEELGMLAGDYLPLDIPQLRHLPPLKPLENLTEPELKYVGDIYLEDDYGNKQIICKDYVFDIRNKWPECEEVINNIRDQSFCMDCWAVASASAFSDRRCIQMVEKKIKFEVNDSFYASAYDTAVCSDAFNKNSCAGGSSSKAWKWFETEGVVSGNNYKEGGCIPYPFPPAYGNSTIQLFNTNQNDCKKICSNNDYGNETFEYELDKRKATNVEVLFQNGLPINQSNWELKMKEEIFNRGTITASFILFKDFVLNYKSQIYYQIKNSGCINKECIGHAVRLIGYGNYTCSNGDYARYWLAVNSFGSDWGDNGLFKIVRGINMADIETRQISFGIPII